MNHNLEDWLVEFDIPSLGGQPDAFAGQAPTSDPTQGMGAPPYADPNVTNQPKGMAPDQAQQMEPEQEPETPDMPEEKDEEDDFEVWKKKFFKETISGDVIKLLHLLGLVRDKELQTYQRKFVDDNWYIQKFREGNSNVLNVSKQMRRLLKQQLDRNNPATSVVNHLYDLLQNEPMLNNVFVKISGYGGLKGELHRKFIAALTNSVQVGNGATNADIIFNESEYSIMMSTRFNSQWGEVNLGNWSLREDDPEKFLSEPELKRLQSGSPEEKDVLRRRVVLESIADQFETRAFIIHVVKEDGTVQVVGVDLANALRNSYSNGTLVVRSKHSDNSEAMIDDNGNILPLIDLSIHYVKDTGELDEDGQPKKDELPFMERRNGILLLTASEGTIKDAAPALSGFVIKEIPYAGNNSDLLTIRRCVYTPVELLMRNC